MNHDVSEYMAALSASRKIRETLAHHRVLPGSQARMADTARPWPPSVRQILEARGIKELYSHQARACDLVRMGKHVVAATPTASGKTLIYNLPLVEEMLANPDSRAIYLSPLKALAQDQLKNFGELVSSIPPRARPTAAIYDGDTKPYARSKLRKEPPNLILTNPEMVHLSMLPFHETWAPFLAGLTHVVVDEVHTYRGVMGSHMAMVFRRLRRVLDYYGASPVWVFCSATLANPGELVRDLTGLTATVVEESGAPQGRRHFLFVNPLGSPSTAAIRLLKEALDRNLRTIVYTKSRRMTELISMWAAEKSGPHKKRISSYRAGFMPEERREIEARMASGELLAVVSTSALELGIDIGSLDVCILVGYPGTIMSTLQRGGRVGRKNQESAVVLVAAEDALDQYFMRHPDDFFARPPEAAVLNPFNPVIMARHLDCAAAELALERGEEFLAAPEVVGGVEKLIAKGKLLEDADGVHVHSRRKRPHREVDLRGAGNSMTIEEQETGEVVGLIDLHRSMRETHPGAVYIHRGRTYVVEKLDLGAGKAVVKPARVGYYTRVRAEKSTEILEVRDHAVVWGTRVFLGRLKVTETITGYEKRRTSDGRLLNVVRLDLPPMVFETEGIWIEVPEEVKEAAEAAYHHFMGGIHAVEHAAIGILPLLVMSDRNDLGGISTPYHPQTGCAAVFIYDGHPGGVGLSRLAFTKAGELLATTLATITSCPCELGCPSCVHSPKCGSGNRPISKDGAIFVLDNLKSSTPRSTEIVPASDELPPDEPPPALTLQPPPAPTRIEAVAEEPALPTCDPQNLRYGVLDIETRRSAQEVGGWHRAERMGVSVAVLYDSREEDFTDYPQESMAELIERLATIDLVVGFNIRRFDYKVLSAFTDQDLSAFPTLDMLEHVRTRLGYRLSLESLASATLGAGKSADGLAALRWWKEGRLDKITHYCRQDVAITRDLYLFGREKGHLLFTNKAGNLVRLPVAW